MLDKGRQPEGAKDTRRSALRRHCDFWDADQDGVIYPWDIFIGFRKLGFNIALCLLVVQHTEILSPTSFVRHLSR